MNAHTVVTIHKALAALWFLLAIGTTAWGAWDPENKFLLAWVIFMSGYANCAGHLAAMAGAGPSEDDGGT
jgi:hypothetical protein